MQSSQIQGKSKDTNFSALMKLLSDKFAKLNTSNQNDILHLLDYVQDEIQSMKIDYVEEEATEERKLYNSQLISGEKDLKDMCTKLGALYKPEDQLPAHVQSEINKIEKEILSTNLFAGYTYKDRFGQSVKVSFKKRVDYLMTQARMQNGLYTVDASHPEIAKLHNAVKKAKYDSMLRYLRDGRRTVALDDLCRSIISNKSQTGEDLKYPFSSTEVASITNALEARKPVR